MTNVSNFGAFVDIGVHQDGLVHISELSDKFVDDPSKVVSVGDVVEVKVIDVDTARRRIGLSRKLQGGSKQPEGHTERGKLSSNSKEDQLGSRQGTGETIKSREMALVGNRKKSTQWTIHG